MTVRRTILSSTYGTQKFTYELDCTLFEVHTFNSEVTESPIEDGSSIVDHIINRPVELSIEAIITGKKELKADGTVVGFSSAKERFGVLNQTRAQGSAVSVLNGMGTYPNMVITNLTITNTPEASIHNDTIRFSMSLKQVVVVNSLQVTITPDKYKKKKKRGKPAIITPGEPFRYRPSHPMEGFNKDKVLQEGRSRPNTIPEEFIEPSNLLKDIPYFSP